MEGLTDISSHQDWRENRRTYETESGDRITAKLEPSEIFGQAIRIDGAGFIQYFDASIYDYQGAVSESIRFLIAHNLGGN